MTPFAERPTAERLALMKLCENSGSLFRDRTAEGFSVAIGRRALGQTMAALGGLGFECAQLYTFPLGTDKPADHLRHDSHGLPACAWLVAVFKVKGT